MNDRRLLWSSIRAENRIFWRTPVAAFFTLGLPLIMLVLFVALFGNGSIGGSDYGPVTTAQFYAAGLAVFAAASATYTNIAIGITTRRDDGVLKRVRGTPIPPWLFLSGVILSAVWIAVFATIVMVGVGVAVYDVSIELDKVPAMLVSFLAGTTCFATLGVAVASLAKTAASGQAVTNATILPLGFVSNVFIPLEDPPAWLTIIGDIFPLKPFAVSFTEAMSPFSEAPAFVWERLAVLVAWTLVGGVVAWRKFRWEPVPGTKPARRRNRRAEADLPT